MDLVRYMRVLRRRWRIIAVLALLGAVAGAVLVPKPNTNPQTGGGAWIAVHTLFDSSANSKASSAKTVGAVTAEQAAFLVKSGDVPDRVAKELGGNANDLSDKVVARPNSNLGTIEITAQAPSPGEARKTADAFAESLLASVQDIQQREVDRRRDVLNSAITQLELELAGVTGDDRGASTSRERLSSDISDKKVALQELDQQAAQGSNIYSFGSSEAFQVTPSQLATLFNNGTSTSGGSQKAKAQVTTRDISKQNSGGGLHLNPMLGAILGLGLGGLAGVMLVLVINTLDPRIFTKEDAEDALGFPVIAEIPAFNRRLRKETIVISREAPYSRFAEAYRVLRSSVLFANAANVEAASGNGNGNGNGALRPPSPPPAPSGAEEGTRRPAVVLMVTSPGPSEGKTTTVSNLATVLAEDGSSILVVNCDFRRPRLHSYLGGGGEPRKVFDTAVPGVKLVTGVIDEPERVAPAEVIGAQRRLIETAKSHFDYILLDTAPILTTNDASELLPVVDMLVMICRSGKTTKEAADRAAELLERFRAPVVGGVLVAAANAPTRQYYYYYAAAMPKNAPEPENNKKNPLEDLQAANRDRNGKSGTAEHADVAPTSDDSPEA